MVRVAVIGAGFMGRTHAAHYAAMPNAHLAGICDVDEKRGRAIAAQYGCPYYATYDQLLEAGTAEAISICLPTFQHQEVSVQAFKRGLHVFCEKPVALEIRAFQAMREAAAAAKKIFMVGQVVRFWPEYVYIKELVESGRLGKLKMAYASRCATLPRWSAWYRRPENSGGGLFDLHLHDIDFLCHAFGRVSSVYAVGVKNDDGCWNHVGSSLTFESGMKAIAEGIIEMPESFPFSTALRIVGDRSAVEHRMTAGVNLEDVGSAKRTTILYEGESAPRPIDIEERDAYLDELRHFVSCVEKGIESPVVPVESVAHVLDVMIALRSSLESGKEVRL